LLLEFFMETTKLLLVVLNVARVSLIQIIDLFLVVAFNVAYDVAKI
jgi:hypothetical protein